jgi:hypothetical protein
LVALLVRLVLDRMPEVLPARRREGLRMPVVLPVLPVPDRMLVAPLVLPVPDRRQVVHPVLLEVRRMPAVLLPVLRTRYLPAVRRIPVLDRRVARVSCPACTLPRRRLAVVSIFLV